MMDSYEKVVNKYVDIAKKYKKSNNAIEFLSDYTDALADYNDFAEKVSKVKKGSMSSADLAYYTKVMARVNKKLLEVK